MGKLAPMTDIERLRCRQSYSVAGKSFNVRTADAEFELTFEHTRKNDLKVAVRKISSGISELDWFSDGNGEYIRRTRLGGIDAPSYADTELESARWWTHASSQGGNKVISAAACKLLERLFMLALEQAVEEVILA